MTQLRFGRLFVLFCMGLAAACTSGTDGGSAGNAEINLWIGNDIDDDGVGDPGATSGELGFNVDRVDYRVTCAGNAPGTYPIPPANTDGTPYQYDDSADFTGQFEVVDGRDPPVWQALEDLPPGLCTISLWVFDGDDLVCSGTQTMGIIEDGAPPTKFDIVLVCSLSIDTPDGSADVDGTFDFITGNLCPKIYTLNAILTDVNPASGLTEIQFRAKDPDNQCGANCDPCTPDFSTNPPTCPPDDPDPGLTCTLAAPGGSFVLKEDIPNPPLPAGTPVGNILPINLNTVAGVPGFVLPGVDILYQCDTTTPGTTTISVSCSDGDIECNKSQTYDIVCPGANLCDGTSTCTLNAECGTAGTCTGGVCDVVTCPSDQCNDPGTCSPGTGACSPGTPLTGTSCTDGGLDGLCNNGVCEASGCGGDDTLCTTASACTDRSCLANGNCSAPFDVLPTPNVCEDTSTGDCSTTTPCPGTCGGTLASPDGICTANGCTDDSPCTPTDPCMVSTCNLATGGCSTPTGGNAGATCEVTVGIPGTCGSGGALGTCVGLCAGVDCSTTNFCTDRTCDVQTGNCSAEVPANENLACTAGNGQTGACTSGLCALTFTGTGEFRAYNNLLPAEGQPATCGGQVPAGPPAGTCTAPSLCDVPGANPPSSICTPCTTPGVQNAAECGVDANGDVLCDTDSFCAPPTSIDVFCIESFPVVNIGFDDDGAGNVAMTGTIDLSFAINTAINLAGDCSLIVPVLIQTNSQTTVNGSGSGSVSPGGSLVLDQLPAPDAAYNVQNGPVTGGVTCDAGAFSATICPLAGLAAGFNPVPLPSDNSLRQYPQINFGGSSGNLTWQTGGGATSADGWFVNNDSGDQFLTLAGSQ